MTRSLSKKCAIVACALACAADGSAATWPVGLTLSLPAIVAFPKAPGEFERSWKAGYGAGIDMASSHTPVVLVFENEFQRFGLDTGRFLAEHGLSGDGVTITGGTSWVFTQLVGLRLQPVHGVVRPYAQASLGPGYIWITDAEVSNGSEATTVPGTTSRKLAFGAGAGLNVCVPNQRVGFTMGAHWTSIQTQGGATAFIPVRAGLTLSLR